MPASSLAQAGQLGALGAVQAALDKARLLGLPVTLPFINRTADGAATGNGVRSSHNAMDVPANFDDLLSQAAAHEGLDVGLLAAVARTESGFNPRAVSVAGAKGVMQLMDDTARSLGVTDSFDAAQNIAGGAKYLRQLLNHYGGDVQRALAAYNAGPGAVDHSGGVPPYAETQAYVQKVMALAGYQSNPLGTPGVSVAAPTPLTTDTVPGIRRTTGRSAALDPYRS